MMRRIGLIAAILLAAPAVAQQNINIYQNSGPGYTQGGPSEPASFQMLPRSAPVTAGGTGCVGGFATAPSYMLVPKTTMVPQTELVDVTRTIMVPKTETVQVPKTTYVPRTEYQAVPVVQGSSCHGRQGGGCTGFQAGAYAASGCQGFTAGAYYGVPAYRGSGPGYGQAAYHSGARYGEKVGANAWATPTGNPPPPFPNKPVGPIRAGVRTMLGYDPG